MPEPIPGEPFQGFEKSYNLGELNCMECYSDAAADCAEAVRKRFRYEPHVVRFVLKEMMQIFTTATHTIDERRKTLGLPPSPKLETQKAGASSEQKDQRGEMGRD